MKKSFYKDKLRVEIFGNKEDMGQDSASFVEEKLKSAIKIERVCQSYSWNGGFTISIT